MCAARLKAAQPPVGKPSLETTDERADTASEMRQRCEHSEPLGSRRQDATTPTTFLRSGDPTFEVREGGRHLGIRGIGDAPAVDLDRPYAAETCGEQRVALGGQFFEGHMAREAVRFRGLAARTKALNSCPVLDGQRLAHCNMELAGSVLKDPSLPFNKQFCCDAQRSIPTIMW